MSDSIADYKHAAFGNTWLEHAAEVIAPDSISWLPNTPFAWVLLLLVVVAAFIGLQRCYRRWRDNAYRRIAVRKILALRKRYGAGDREALKELPELLRRVSLSVLPRSVVAGFDQQAWRRCLIDMSPEIETQSEIDVVQRLLELAYVSPAVRETISPQTADQYFSWCERWVVEHRCSDRHESESVA